MICAVVVLFILATCLLPAQTDPARYRAQSASPTQDAQIQSSPTPRQQPGQLSKPASVPPLTIKDKFNYRIVGSFSLRGLFGNLVGAAIGQAMNTPGEWGQGWGAYGERYASGLGGTLSRQVFAFTIESAFHEDPRYFPSEEKTKGARVKNVLKSVIITRTDSGEGRFAYGRVVSAFGSGQLVNAWQPRSNGHVSDGIERAFIVLGVDAGYNLMQEFLPFVRPKPLRHRP
ncbi:MAG: hypothetical protein ACR2IV_09280 [Bryobacteraceae bacterium]